MAEHNIELAEVYLQPGEVYLARSPTVLKTLLGSCVGVTFWSPRLGLGALCHGVLPRCPAGVRNLDGNRYVDFAICHLIRLLEGFGAVSGEVQVKVFGGADTLPVIADRSWRATVGQQNCQSALEVLRRQSYAVLTSDTGGVAGRTINFDTSTGIVLVRHLSPLNRGRPGAAKLRHSHEP
jgi:chemotaxis protein CheD